MPALLRAQTTPYLCARPFLPLPSSPSDVRTQLQPRPTALSSIPSLLLGPGALHCIRCTFLTNPIYTRCELNHGIVLPLTRQPHGSTQPQGFALGKANFYAFAHHHKSEVKPPAFGQPQIPLSCTRTQPLPLVSTQTISIAN